MLRTLLSIKQDSLEISLTVPLRYLLFRDQMVSILIKRRSFKDLLINLKNLKSIFLGEGKVSNNLFTLFVIFVLKTKNRFLRAVQTFLYRVQTLISFLSIVDSDLTHQFLKSLNHFNSIKCLLKNSQLVISVILFIKNMDAKETRNNILIWFCNQVYYNLKA